MDLTSVIVTGLLLLEKRYEIEPDDIDIWDQEEASDFVSNLLEENPDIEVL